jgi:hypothetical protein
MKLSIFIIIAIIGVIAFARKRITGAIANNKTCKMHP